MILLIIKNIESCHSERVPFDILDIELKKQTEGDAERVSFSFLERDRSSGYP